MTAILLMTECANQNKTKPKPHLFNYLSLIVVLPTWHNVAGSLMTTEYVNNHTWKLQNCISTHKVTLTMQSRSTGEILNALSS